MNEAAAPLSVVESDGIGIESRGGDAPNLLASEMERFQWIRNSVAAVCFSESWANSPDGGDWDSTS
jgi:hypothetical protein